MTRDDILEYRAAKVRLLAALSTLELGAYPLAEILAATEPSIGIFTSAAMDFVMNEGVGVQTVIRRLEGRCGVFGYELFLIVHPDVLEHLNVDSDAWTGPTLHLKPAHDIFPPILREHLSDLLDDCDEDGAIAS